MRALIIILLFCIPCIGFSQVGINTTRPNALLDIQSSSQVSPTNTDGLLIPKIDEYPSANPTAAQDGMMVYATGTGSVSKGFYFWDNTITSWKPFSGTSIEKIDDLIDGKSDNDGSDNGSSIFLGINSGVNDDETNNYNAGFGISALTDNTSGSNNSAFGNRALRMNTTGSRNVGLGSRSGWNSNGSNNVFIGYESGFSELNSNRLYIENSSSTSPLIYGEFDNDLLRVNGDLEIVKTTNSSLKVKTNDGNSSSLSLVEGADYGFEFLYTGSDDKLSLWSRTFTGNEGERMTWLKNGKVGINDTAPDALLDIEATNSATPTNTDGILIPRINSFPATNPTVDQNGMLVFLTTDNMFYFWRNSTTSWVSINSSGSQRIDDLIDGKSDSDGTDDGSSIFLGINAGLNDNGFNNFNVGIGFNALLSNIYGDYNVAFGYQSLYNNTSGRRNSAIGYRTLYNNTSGFSSVAIGHETLFNNTEGLANIGIGFHSMFLNTLGNYNVAVGVDALQSNTIGNNNVAIGINSLENNSTGSDNVAIGDHSGLNLNGSRNVFIGHSTGGNGLGFINIDNSVFIGSNAGSYETNSNRLYIENSDSTSPLIYGEFDNDLLRVNGNLEVVYTNATLSLNGLQISDLGANILGLDGDIVPYNNVNFDLGNVNATQHWDDVVAVSFVTFSDRNTKNNINSLAIGLKELLQLNPVSFIYNKDITANDKVHIGLIAQEVNQIIPEVVISEDIDINPVNGEKIITKGEYLAMNYMELIPVLIKATQEQQDIIKKQQGEIESLKDDIEEIKALLKKD